MKRNDWFRTLVLGGMTVVALGGCNLMREPSTSGKTSDDTGSDFSLAADTSSFEASPEAEGETSGTTGEVSAEGAKGPLLGRVRLMVKRILSLDAAAQSATEILLGNLDTSSGSCVKFENVTVTSEGVLTIARTPEVTDTNTYVLSEDKKTLTVNMTVDGPGIRRLVLANQATTVDVTGETSACDDDTTDSLVQEDTWTGPFGRISATRYLDSSGKHGIVQRTVLVKKPE